MHSARRAPLDIPNNSLLNFYSVINFTINNRCSRAKLQWPHSIGYHHVWVGNRKSARRWSVRGLLMHELRSGNLISICAFNWYLTQFIGFVIYQIDQFIICAEKKEEKILWKFLVNFKALHHHHRRSRISAADEKFNYIKLLNFYVLRHIVYCIMWHILHWWWRSCKKIFNDVLACTSSSLPAVGVVRETCCARVLTSESESLSLGEK